MFDVTVIGPAVIDILASPVDLDAIAAGSRDLDRIRMSFGGDALNEAVALSRLGRKVRLISKVGDDVAGRRILSYMEENGIPTDDVRVQEGLDTAINIALIDVRNCLFCQHVYFASFHDPKDGRAVFCD